MEKLKNIKLTKKQQTTIILVCIYLMMLILNLLTPILADDYSYSLSLDDSKINSFMDIINYQWWHYFNWGGRTVAHTIAQVFLLFPKVIFSIVNPLIYICLVYLIYLHAKGNKESNPLFLLLIHLGLWFLLPVFGQTCLWVVGSCNYLWTTVIILWFLWIYRNKKSNPSIIKLIGIFFLGILAGWTNENTSAGLIVILLGYMIVQKVFSKKEKIPKIQIVGLIGTILGFLVMILAPGNFVRTTAFQDDSFFLVKIIKRAIDMTITAGNYLLPIVVILVIAISIKIYHKKKIENDVYIFLVGGLATIYSMVLSPTFPERSWTGVIVFLLIAMFNLLYDVEKISKLYKYIIVDCCIILSFTYITDYIALGIDINNLRNTWEYRVNKIEKMDDNSKAVFDRYTTYNPKNPAYGLSDLNTNKNEWPNTSIAEYYGIKSIKAKEY